MLTASFASTRVFFSKSLSPAYRTLTVCATKNMKLPTGASMPAVGLGTWKIDKATTTSLVRDAIREGYRAIDCACDYGNEEEVGIAISGAIADDEVSRSELFITSKLWNTYHQLEHVRPACERSLKDLKVEYLDLYLIHFPISLKYVPFDTRYPPEWIHDPTAPDGGKLEPDASASIFETWRGMEQLVDAGLVRNIGICNFPVALIMQLLSTARIKPAMLQVELHPYLTQPRLLDYCLRNDIAVTAFSPLGAPGYIQLGMDEGCGKGAMNDQVVCDIANRLNRSPAQVLLKWGVQRGTAVIPKTSRSGRLAENFNLDFSLSDEDMKSIAALNRGLRFNDPGKFCTGMGLSLPIYD